MAKRIMLVEDDRRTRESMTVLLRHLGHEVQAYRSAEDATPAVARYRPEVALLDIQLPGARGDDFAADLQMHCPATRIIFVSSEDAPHRAERFGANVTFMPKPVDIPVLASRLNN